MSSSITPLYFPGPKCSGGVPRDNRAHRDLYIFRQIILIKYFSHLINKTIARLLPVIVRIQPGIVT